MLGDIVCQQHRLPVAFGSQRQQRAATLHDTGIRCRQRGDEAQLAKGLRFVVLEGQAVGDTELWAYTAVPVTGAGLIGLLLCWCASLLRARLDAATAHVFGHAHRTGHLDEAWKNRLALHVAFAGAGRYVRTGLHRKDAAVANLQRAVLDDLARRHHDARVGQRVPVGGIVANRGHRHRANVACHQRRGADAKQQAGDAGNEAAAGGSSRTRRRQGVSVIG